MDGFCFVVHCQWVMRNAMPTLCPRLFTSARDRSIGGKSAAAMAARKLAVQFFAKLQVSEDMRMGEIVMLSLIVGALGALTFFYFRIF